VSTRGRPPTRYGGLTGHELAAALDAWFDRHLGGRDCWNRTAPGRTIRARLQAAGNFRLRPRGNPALGRAVMLARRAAERVAELRAG